MRPIYYDTETTGVKPDKDRIVELAAFDPERDKTFCTLIDPEIPIPIEATNISGISTLMVQGAPKFSDAFDQFVAFCEGDVVLIAHNNDAFDKPFLEEEAKRSSKVLPPWTFIDSLKWARKYRNDLPRHSLQILREIYGIKANQAHRALDDVLVLHQVFSHMIDDLPIQKVVELLKTKQALTRMPFGKYQGKNLSEVPKDYITWLMSNGALDKPDNQELKEKLLTLRANK